MTASCITKHTCRIHDSGKIVRGESHATPFLCYYLIARIRTHEPIWLSGRENASDAWQVPLFVRNLGKRLSVLSFFLFPLRASPSSMCLYICRCRHFARLDFYNHRLRLARSVGERRSARDSRHGRRLFLAPLPSQSNSTAIHSISFSDDEVHEDALQEEKKAVAVSARQTGRNYRDPEILSTVFRPPHAFTLVSFRAGADWVQ